MLIVFISGFVLGIPILLQVLAGTVFSNPFPFLRQSPLLKVLHSGAGLLVFAGATLLTGLLGGVFWGLKALLYNLVARRTGGLKVELVRAEARVETSVENSVLEIKYIHVVSALLIGLPVALFGLLIEGAIFLVLSGALNWGFESLILDLLQHSTVIHLVILSLLEWPLWTLFYNWLAQRNGGLVLEVTGEWPELAQEAGAGA